MTPGDSMEAENLKIENDYVILERIEWLRESSTYYIYYACAYCFSMFSIFCGVFW